jgi:S-adenosylmethionine synthetase
VETFGTGNIPDAVLERAVREVFDLTPAGFINGLDLRNPIYRPTASYGHFGRTPQLATVHGKDVKLFTWEDPARVSQLTEAAQQLEMAGA